MSLDADLSALGAIDVAETTEPSSQTADAKVTEALNNTDMDNVESLLVDFGRIEAEQQRAEGLAIATERLRSDGKIDMLTAQSLTSVSRTIMGTGSNKAYFTEVATKVGFNKALESLTSEEEAARTLVKHASNELIVKAGKLAQSQLVNLKANSRAAVLELARTMAAFSDEYFSVNLRDVVLNQGEIQMEEVLNDSIVLSSPLYSEQSMFAACKSKLTALTVATDTAQVARWINTDKHYIVLDGSLIDVEQCTTERAFTNKSAYYSDDQPKPKLGDIIQAAGSPAQADYEAILVDGITEGIYQLQGFLNKETDEINPDVNLADAIYLAKVISAMTRTYAASIGVTEVAACVYSCLVNHPRNQ